MTRTGDIGLSQIARIQIYVSNVRNTRSGLQSILKKTGGTFVMNGPIFLSSLKPCCHLKADGRVLCDPDYRNWGISWNTPEDFCVELVDSGRQNYLECVWMIAEGQKRASFDGHPDMARATHRTAVGVKDGRFAYYAGEDNHTRESLRDLLAAGGWSGAILLDGGGSSCFMDNKGSGFAGDGRVIPIWIVVTMKNNAMPDNEPEGGLPMVEVVSYSLKEDGNKYLTKNFQVKEFKCKDGTDPIFVAKELPMVLQYIRMRVGNAVIINSAYRTADYNAQVGGVDASQHCYGTAADIVVNGYTPKTIAEIAREIMPDWGGVGIYSNFTHVDVRAKKSDWNG